MVNGGSKGGNVLGSRMPLQQGGTPKTVLACVPVQMFATQIVDEGGTRRTTVAFKIGDAWYHDPDGERWTEKLRLVRPDTWLAKSLEAEFRRHTASPVPKEDAVDVLEGP